jgi:hypothetical protein
MDQLQCSIEGGERSHDLFLGPQRIEDTRQESDGDATRRLRRLCQSLNESLVFGGASTDGDGFEEVARGEGGEDLGSDETSEELVVDLVWEVGGEDLAEIRGHVGGGDDLEGGGGWGREDEGEGEHASFLRDEDEGELDHASCTGELVEVVGAEDGRVVLERHDGRDSAASRFDEVDDLAEAKLAGVDAREGGRVLESSEDGEVEELVRGHAQLGEDGRLGGEGEGRGEEIDVEDDAVDPVEHEDLARAVDGVHVRALVSLEVDELGPGKIRRDNKLDAALLEQPVDHAHDVLGHDRARRAELGLRLGYPTLLVVLPRLCPPPRLGVLRNERSLLLLRRETRENEHGLDARLLQRLEVVFNLTMVPRCELMRLDAPAPVLPPSLCPSSYHLETSCTTKRSPGTDLGREGERRTSYSWNEVVARRRVSRREQSSEVMIRIDTDARTRESRQGRVLDEAAFRQEVCART